MTAQTATADPIIKQMTLFDRRLPARVARVPSLRPVRARLSESVLMEVTDGGLDNGCGPPFRVGDALLLIAAASFAVSSFELRFGLFQLGLLLSS